MKNFTATISTRVDRDSDVDTRTLTFDLSGLTDEDMLELAQRSIVIQAQSAWRTWMRGDKSKPSPWTGDVYKVPKPGTRTANPEKTLESAKKALGKLTKEQLAALLEAIQ